MRIALYIGGILLCLCFALGLIGIIYTIIKAVIYKQHDINLPTIIYVPAFTIAILVYGIMIIMLCLKLQIEKLWTKLVTQSA